METEEHKGQVVCDEDLFRCTVCDKVIRHPAGIIHSMFRQVFLNRNDRIAEVEITEMCCDCAVKVHDFIVNNLVNGETDETEP